MSETSASPLSAAILALLAPLLGAGGLAAAQQAVAAYHATEPDQIISIAQIVGFSMISLDSLRISMPEDLSLPMKLKLRGNANALARSSVQAKTLLEAQRREAEYRDSEQTDAHGETGSPPLDTASGTEPRKAPPSQAGAPPDETPVRPASATPAPKPPASQQDLSWAAAMNKVAAQFTTELAGLPLAERRLQGRRIGALNQTAAALTAGDAPPLRSRLLSSAALLTTPHAAANFSKRPA